MKAAVALPVLLLAGCGGNPVQESTVVAKKREPGRVWTTTTVTPQGGLRVVQYRDDADWVIRVRLPTGRVVRWDTNRETWERLQVGGKVR